jgi:hypothetical protein
VSSRKAPGTQCTSTHCHRAASPGPVTSCTREPSHAATGKGTTSVVSRCNANNHCSSSRISWVLWYPGACRRRANRNHVTTPVGHSVVPEQTITVIDPRHPLCGRTLPLVAMTHHAALGHCCVVWLRPQVERLVPVRATNLAFDPNDISPSPLSLTAVEQLLRVVHDIEHARRGVHSDASPARPSGTVTRARQPDCPPPALGVPVQEPATARTNSADPRRTTCGRVSATPSTL